MRPLYEADIQCDCIINSSYSHYFTLDSRSSYDENGLMKLAPGTDKTEFHTQPKKSNGKGVQTIKDSIKV